MSIVPYSVYLSAPSTVRAQPVTLSTDLKGNLLVYPSGTTVVVRPMGDPKAEPIICTKHSVAVTAARVSPKGDTVASGDKDGNLLIWLVKPDTRVLLQQKALGGAIKDIAWDEEGERLVAVGEGKTTFGVTISSNGGNSIGQINGHDKGIVSCDMRKGRPYRVATGGADSAVGFFEGVPFKFHHTVSGQHTNNVTCVKFNPAGDLVASTSGKNTVVLMDGKTGEFQRAVPTTHTGTILGLTWNKEGSAYYTCSADKTVKGYKVDGSELFSTSFNNSIPFMQQGLVFLNAGLVSCGFNGELAVLNPESGSIGATLRGHSRPVVSTLYLPSGALLTASTDGTLLLWSEDGQAAAFTGSQPELLSGVSCSPSGKWVWAVGGTELISVGISMGKLEPVGKAAAPILGVAALSDSAAALLHKASLAVYSAEGKLVTEEKLVQEGGGRFDAVSIAAHPASGLVAVGGDKVVKVYKFDGSKLQPVFTLTGTHKGDVSALAFSADGTTIASGDTSRLIFVWDAASGKIHYDDLVFHNTKITALAFGSNNSTIVSGSVDASIILWDLANKKRATVANAHFGGVTALALHPVLPRIVSSGSDSLVRQWSFE